MERGVFAFACQCIVSLRGRTSNRTVTQMRHPLLVEGRPSCAGQSLASTVSAPRVAATSYCDPGRHTNVITPCLLTPCLHVPKNKEVRPFLLGDNSIEVFRYFGLAIIAFGACGFIVLKCYCRLGKMDKRSLDTLIHGGYGLQGFVERSGHKP